MGQAPSDQLAITVWVVSESGSYTVRKETPASYPSIITPWPGGVQPEAEAVAAALRWHIAAWAPRLGQHCLGRERRHPERPSRVDARRPQWCTRLRRRCLVGADAETLLRCPWACQITKRSPLRKRIGPQVRGVGQVGRCADPLLHQVDGSWCRRPVRRAGPGRRNRRCCTRSARPAERTA